MTAPRKRTAILISGRGSNMKSLVEAARHPNYAAEIVVVISNRPDAPGITWAKEQGIPAIAMDHKLYSDRAHFESQLQGLLTTSRVELVCLAGFMRLMTPGFVELWRDRMLNIHPALLPAFKGLDTHARALEAGVKFAGCTVHVVRPEMDEGPILGQAAVPVFATDTEPDLAARVLAAEHQLYPRILELFARGQIAIDGNKTSTRSDVNATWAKFSPQV
ncbi:MAG: phosphoribosylglycinamide formyltransferase [Hyphomonas sp.]|nr:phosphoribosylglycinamide formyltransferase [Hyphomonas sp.]